MAADEFIWRPSNGTGFDRNPKVDEIQYEGYEAASPAGINNNPLKGALTFNNVGLTVAKAIDDFLSSKNGATPFTFTLPAPWDEKQRTWRCKVWGWVYIGGAISGVRAEFSEFQQ